MPEIDASLTGGQVLEGEKGVSSPTGKSRETYRRASQGFDQMGQFAQRQTFNVYETATSSENLLLARNWAVGAASSAALDAAASTMEAGEVSNTQLNTERISTNAELAKTFV